MSYTKQTWQAGDEVTSAKLNHMEDGINNVAIEVASFPVDIDNPQDGDTLIYNAAEQKWVSSPNSSDSGRSSLIVHINNYSFDKTWKEIHDALADGKYVVIIESNEYEIYQNVIHAASYNNGSYEIHTTSSTYASNSENGYPLSGK